MFTIVRKWVRGEEDICATHNSMYDYFESRSVAELIAKDLTKEMSKDSWYGFKWYGDKFYVKEVSDEYLACVQGRNARMLASMM